MTLPYFLIWLCLAVGYAFIAYNLLCHLERKAERVEPFDGEYEGYHRALLAELEKELP